VLWLTSILDGALARRGRFLQRLGREKLRLAFRVSADAQWVSGGVFWGSTRKNLTCCGWMKGPQSPTKVTCCNLDQPCSLSAVTRHPNREESKRCAAQGCRRGKSTKPLGLLSDPPVRRGAAIPDERASRASDRTKESSHTAGPVFGGRDECACGGPPQIEPTLFPRTTQLRSLVLRHPSWRVHTI
jgi:hypothetical protein